MASRRRNHFKFTEKTQSIKGVIALCVAAVLLIVYLVLFGMAYKSYGQLTAYHGSVGVFAIVVTLINLIFVIQSMREENSYQLIPRCALGVTLLEGVLWIFTFAIGV